MRPAPLFGLLLLFCALPWATALDNGLGLTPPMGFNTWNAFGTNIDEKTVKGMADLMVKLGLKDAGYEYINLDDGWSEKERDPLGRLVGNKLKFPSGIKALADYVHSKGLKFGIYSDAGSMTCAKYPGSLGYEAVDAQTFADWGVDYLKYDNCYVKKEEWVLDRYAAMRDALNATGRPIFYSLCEWGVMEPWLWGPAIGNSWRTTEDIQPTWDNVVKLLEYSTGLARFSGPKLGWSDMDMLFVGNDHLGEYHPYGPFYQEQKTHFALWALMKSPLLIGHDLLNLNKTSLALLKKKEIIAINQDKLGVPGDLVWQQGTRKVFAGPLAGGDRAVALANFQTTQSQYPMSNITVFWEQIGLARGQRCTVRDLYGERDLGVFSGSFSAAVPVHDVAVLRIAPVGPPRDDTWRPWHGQPLYAPQPANLAVPTAEAWIAGYTGASKGSKQQQQQRAPVASGKQPAKQQQQKEEAHGGALPAAKQPFSYGLLLGVLAAVAVVGALGYFALLQMRLRGWTALQGSDDRKAAELAAQQNPNWRDQLGVSNILMSTPATKP